MGWEDEILLSDNGGDNWLLHSSVHLSGNLDVQFVNDKVGIIVGGIGNDAEAQNIIDGGLI